MADLGKLAYDLTIEEKQLDKDIKSIDDKLKKKNKDWERYLKLDFNQATKGALSYQKILQAQNATESKRLINTQKQIQATEQAAASASRSAEVSRRSAANALTDEQKLTQAKIRTVKAQLQFENAQKRSAAQAKKTSSAYKQQGLLMQNLNTLAASYASIFAVARIANKIREVTGEFELQNKALAAILQNKEKADQLFGQVTDLALKSPFAIKELLTYTKQLAAYRIETESLIPTLTQLADVSAGLGVDMSRLILAYGQVRAASVLRGCFGLNTPVLKADGDIVPVQNIKAGDILVGDDDSTREVQEIIRGNEQMYWIKQSNADDYRVNYGHIMTLLKDGELVDIYLADLLKEDVSKYKGVNAITGEISDIEIVKDIVDDYYGFVIDGNKRFLGGDGSIYHNTELRQFTEAGIPLVQLLSDKFSILEGRVVSTNEVFDKISNRMVSFAMVSEVFQEMTEQGGTFFEAQAVQAKTLAGMWNILGDAIDKAMFAIGTEHIDVLKGAVQGATDLTRSWEDLLSILKTLIVAYGAYRVAQILINKSRAKSLILLRSEATSLKSLTFAQKRANLEQLKAVSTAHKLRVALRGLKGALGGLAIGALFGIASALNDAYVESNRFNKELDAIANSEFIKGGKLISGFEDMAKSAIDAADGSKDQRDALVDLNRVYKDYLPNQVLTIKGLKGLTDGYDSVTEAINRKVEAQAREKGLAAIDAEFKEREAVRTEALVSSLVGDNKLTQEAARAFVTNFKNSINQAIESGEDFNVFKELNKQLNEFTGKDITSQFSEDLFEGFGSIQGNARAFIGVLNDVADSQGRLNDQLEARFKIPSGQYENEINTLKKFKEEYEATVEEIKASGDLTDTQVDEKKLEAQKSQLESVIQLYKDLSVAAFIAGDNTGKVNYFGKKIEDAEAALAKLVITQDAYKQSISDIIKAEGTSKGFGKIFDVTDQETIITHQKRVAESYAKIRNEITVTEKAVIRLNKEEKDVSLLNSKIERLKIEQQIAEAIIKAYGIKLKSDDIEKAEIVKLKAQAKLLTDIKKAREDLSKTLSAEKVEESIQKLFGIQADDLGITIPITSDTTAFYDQLQDLVTQAEALGTKAGDALAKSFSSKIATLQVKDLSDAAKSALKALDVEIKKSKGKYDFYKDVLGITGDEEIALKFGIDKRQFTEVLKEATEIAAKKFGIEGSFDDIAALDNLPPEVAKKVAAVNNSIEESTKNAILDKLKFLEQSIPEGLGLEFDFSNVISDLDKKVKELKREVAKAVVSADTGEAEKINELQALRIKAISEEARQRAEKIGGAYVKEQLEIKQLGNAYSNMTDASLRDIEKILAALKESKDDLLSEDGIAAILSRANISGTAETSFFSGLSDSENINEFLLKLNEIENEVSNIDELRIGDEIIDEEQLGKLRAVVEVFQAMGIAINNASETTEQFKTDKQVAEWKKLSTEMLGVIDIMSGVGDAFGDDLSESGKRAIAGIKGVVGAVTSGITTAADVAGKSLSALEKASVILTVISTALQLVRGLQNILESAEDAENERLAAASLLSAQRLEIENKINDRIREREGLQDKNILLNQDFARDISSAFDDFYVEADKFNAAMESLGSEGILSGQGSARNLWGKTTKEFNATFADLAEGITRSTKKIGGDIFDILGSGKSARATRRAQRDLIKSFTTTLESMGKTASDVAGFTNDEWLVFYQTMNDLGAVTDEGTKKFLEMAEAASEAMKEAQEAMDSFIVDLAGGLENDLANALRNGFEQGVDAAEAFKNSVEDIMEELVLQGIINTLFDDAFADLAANIKNSFDPADGDADKSIIDDLAKFYDATGGLYEDAIKAIDEAKKDAESRGFDLFGGTEELGSLAKGIQGVTEDTARRLEAIINSIREVNIGDSSKMDSIISIMNNQSITASQSIAHLQSIDNNVLAFKTAFESVMTNTASAGGTGIGVYIKG
jgi:hypothetical protein